MINNGSVPSFPTSGHHGEPEKLLPFSIRLYELYCTSNQNLKLNQKGPAISHDYLNVLTAKTVESVGRIRPFYKL